MFLDRRAAAGPALAAGRVNDCGRVCSHEYEIPLAPRLRCCGRLLVACSASVGAVRYSDSRPEQPAAPPSCRCCAGGRQRRPERRHHRRLSGDAGVRRRTLQPARGRGRLAAAERVQAPRRQVLRGGQQGRYAARLSDERLGQVRRALRHRRPIPGVFGLYDNPVVQSLANRVGQSVVASKVPRLYTFKLVADPVPWAEALSTGTMASPPAWSR